MNNFYKGGRGLSFFKHLFRLFKSRNNRSRTLYGIAIPLCFSMNLSFSIRSFSLMALKNKVVLPCGLLCFMLFNLSEARTQPRDHLGAAERRTEIKPLEIGDTIPEQLWNLPLQVVNHPNGKDTITLNDYRDKKLIILDFWATWCAPCIASLVKLENIEKKLAADFKLIPVTRENTETIAKRLAHRELKPFSIYNDTLLNSIFPHRSIPHQIWVKGDSIVHISDASHSTEEHIRATIGGELPAMEAKFEMLDFDKLKPLEIYAERVDAPVYHQSTLTGRIKGIGSRRGYAYDGDDKILFLNNSRILDVYKWKYTITPNRIIPEMEPAEMDSKAEDLLNLWFSYQLRVPKETPDSNCIKLLTSEMEQAFGLSGHMEERQVSVKSIVRDVSIKSVPYSMTTNTIKLANLINGLNDSNNWFKELPIYTTEEADATIIHTMFSLNELVNDEQKLVEVMRMNGLRLVDDIRSIPMLVVKQTNE